MGQTTFTMTLDDFVNLSTVLTGYEKDTLQPRNDTYQIANQLFMELSNPKNEIPPSQLELLSATWSGISKAPSDQWPARVEVEIIGNAAISRLAQNIIYMWYLGIWYDLLKNPNCFVFPNHVDPNHVSRDHVVSSDTYINGLVWGEMGAHPMGFSTDVFGYWENPAVLPPIPTSQS